MKEEFVPYLQAVPHVKVGIAALWQFQMVTRREKAPMVAWLLSHPEGQLPKAAQEE